VSTFLGQYEDRIYPVTRFVIGFLYACHGAQKLFGVLGGTRALMIRKVCSPESSNFLEDRSSPSAYLPVLPPSSRAAKWPLPPSRLTRLTDSGRFGTAANAPCFTAFSFSTSPRRGRDASVLNAPFGG